MELQEGLALLGSVMFKHKPEPTNSLRFLFRFQGDDFTAQFLGSPGFPFLSFLLCRHFLGRLPVAVVLKFLIDFLFGDFEVACMADTLCH